MTEIAEYRQYTGEPNRIPDLDALGLVRPGNHFDITTVTINIAGVPREVRVKPRSSTTAATGEVVTILRPVKADFRNAVRAAGDMSLRPLRPTR